MLLKPTALGMLAAAAMVASAAQGQELKLGAINPLSGGLALYGDELNRGYEIAVEAANAKGGVLGRKVVLVKGNASTAQEGITAVEQLASRDKVDAFIGTYISAISTAASEAALGNNKLYWDTNAIAAELTERGLPNFIRVGPWSGTFAQQSADAVIKLISTTMGKAPKDVKVWLEHEDSVYGASVVKDQEKILKEAGVQVAGIGAHNFRAIDLNPSILRAKNANPDIWVQTGYIPDSNLLLRTARDQGFKPQAMLLVGTGDTSETLEALGKEYLEGVLVVSYPRYDINPKYGPGATEFLKAYKAKYNRDPIAPQTMAAYVGAKVLLETIQAAGSADVDKVRAAAAKLDKPLGTYETGFGIKFDAKFTNTRAFPVVAQWQDGKMVTVYPAEAAAEGSKVTDMRRK